MKKNRTAAFTLILLLFSGCNNSNESTEANDSDAETETNQGSDADDSNAGYDHLGQYCDGALLTLWVKCGQENPEFFESIKRCLYEKVFDCNAIGSCLAELDVCDGGAFRDCIETTAVCKLGECELTELDCKDSKFYGTKNTSSYDFEMVFDNCIMTREEGSDLGAGYAICYAGECVSPDELKQQVCVTE